MTRSGARSTSSPSAMASRRQGWRSGPASTPPPSTSPSASAATGASAGLDRVARQDPGGHRGLARRVHVAGGQSGRRPCAPAHLPIIGFAQAGAGGFFDDHGMPAGTGWDEAAFPMSATSRSTRWRAGESMLPLYRDGDVIIVSPTAAVRRGDRVVVRTTDGEVMAKELKRKTLKTVELASLNPRSSRARAAARGRRLHRPDRLGEPVSAAPAPRRGCAWSGPIPAGQRPCPPARRLSVRTAADSDSAGIDG